MRPIFQILFLFLICLNNLSATPVFVKVALPSYELTFSKTECIKEGIGEYCYAFSAGKIIQIATNDAAYVKIGNSKNCYYYNASGKLVEGGEFNVFRKVSTGEIFIVEVQQVVRHPNWVEITDIPNKVNSLIPHVLKVETTNGNFTSKVLNKNGQQYTIEGFQGCHTENAMKEYVQIHGGTYTVKNKSIGLGGVYDGQPIIYLNGKEYVKTNGFFVEYESGKWGGTSTMFPETWDDPRIIEEVTHAVENNHGLVPGQPNGGSLMFGFSKDGVIEIRFAFNSNGKGTYYAIKK